MAKHELLKKYNVPAPRYTSYPTVPYWENTPTQEEWLQHLQRAIGTEKDRCAGAALYMHIPFCESLCTFCGCNTRITKNHGVAHPYIEKLQQEWNIYQKALAGAHQVKLAELHLGGGTPTFFSAEELKSLLEPILSDVEIDSQQAFSLEVDPRVTTKEQLVTLAKLGFNRISMGIQDFDARVQKVVNRVQPFEQVQRVTEWAREAGYTSINYDLIYGLPLQTEATINATFAKVLSLAPERIAYYAYAHVPWIKPTHRKFSHDDLPAPSAKRRLYELGRQLLEEGGYREIGMDHFATSSDDLWLAAEHGTLHRNFMGYTSQRVTPLIGIGVSAIGDAGTAFLQNEKVLEKYYARLEHGELPVLRGHLLSNEDLVLRHHILNLMTSFSTSWSEPHVFTSFLEGVPERLIELEQDGLVQIGDRQLKILPLGRPFIRNIAMAFDARLSRKAPETILFSKSI